MLLVVVGRVKSYRLSVVHLILYTGLGLPFIIIYYALSSNKSQYLL